MIAAAVLTAALALSPCADSAMPQLTAHATAPIMQGQATPYKGKYWVKAQKKYTLCVLHYESRSNWFSTARADGYFGGFKFTKALTSGATWMMTKELREMFGDAKGRKVARELRATEMQKWLPFYQHMAFATVLNWEGAGSGQSHWAAQRKRCFL